MDTGISTSSGLTVKQWADDYFAKTLDQLSFKPYMGTDASAVIHMKEDLVKKKGDALTFNLLGALEGEGVSGDSVLEGSEEELPAYSQQVVLNQFRNAVRDEGSLSSQRYPFEIRDAFRPALLNWQQQFVERKIIAALQSIDGVLYSAATAGQRNTWNANNSDRVLYGALESNYNATHATALANVDASGDQLSCDMITLAKTLAKTCDPLIRPIRMENGEEVFVLFASPKATRGLKASSDWKSANRDGMPRGSGNPIFTGALGMWDGVVIVECQKVPLIASAGASSIDVAHNFLCGAQALLWAQGGIGGDRLKVVEKSFDYENQVGVAISSMWEINKARFAVGASGVTKDHGVLHLFTAGESA